MITAVYRLPIAMGLMPRCDGSIQRCNRTRDSIGERVYEGRPRSLFSTVRATLGIDLTAVPRPCERFHQKR